MSSSLDSYIPLDLDEASYTIERDIRVRLKHYEGFLINRQLYDGMRMAVEVYLRDLLSRREISRYNVFWDEMMTRLTWEVQTHSCHLISGDFFLHREEPIREDPSLVQLINEVFK